MKVNLLSIWDNSLRYYMFAHFYHISFLRLDWRIFFLYLLRLIFRNQDKQQQLKADQKQTAQTFHLVLQGRSISGT